MRLIRFRRGLEAAAGALLGDDVHALELDAAGAPRAGARVAALAEVTLLCPVTPRQVVSVGANYAERCRENQLSIPTAPGLDDTFVLDGDGPVVGPGAPIRLPPWERHVEYGAELGIVIGRDAARVDVARAPAHVLGYVALNNLWAKTRPRIPGAMYIRVYDSFCPVGPWVETAFDPADRRIVLRVDGELRQDSRTSAMLFDVATIVAHVSAAITLAAGDLIMTGTPAGVRPIAAGQTLEVEIEGLGALRNPVVADPSVARRPLRRIRE